MFRLIPVGVLILSLAPAVAWAQNNTSARPQSLMINGSGAVSSSIAASPNDQRWWWTAVTSRRSYCVETAGGTSFEANDSNTVVAIFQSNLTTVLASNDNASGEPYGGNLSRACFESPYSGTVYVRVTPSSVGAAFSFSVRMVDTTLFSDWFFTGGDYHSYTLLRNTTTSPVSYSVTWRNASGYPLFTVSNTIYADGSAYFDGVNFSPVRAAISGTVDITHNGSPDAIAASTTVMSTTTGLSFDAPFMRRRGW